MKWSEILGVISSVASITGVSVIWASEALKGASPLQVANYAATAVVASLFSIGLIFGVTLLLLWLDSQIPYIQLRILYWCFAAGVAVWGCFYTLVFIWFMAADLGRTVFSG